MRFAINNLAQRFAELSPRERLLAVGGALFVVVYAAYLLFYQPVAEQNRLLAQKIQAQRQICFYLQKVSDEVAQLRQQFPPDAVDTDTTNQSPMAVVDISSQQMQIKAMIKHLSPEGDDKVSVLIEQLSFDNFIAWLAALETKHHLRVLQMELDKTVDSEGLVNAKVLLGI